MPNYFNGYEIVAETRNFLITCDNDSGARQRAQIVGASCDYDLSRLNDLFSSSGLTNDRGIWVHCAQDSSSGPNGVNHGYETDESSRIAILRGFTLPAPQAPPADPPITPLPNYAAAVEQFPRFVFVAELAEILMDFTGYGWGAGNSMGEGLSNLLGALFYPAGYYDSGQGPRVNQWINGSSGPTPIPAQYDWVSATEDTDLNVYSYGCSILFINYLVSQLNYSLKDVIRAGGATLAETFSRLTGKPANLAYSDFTGLLNSHIYRATDIKLGRDNIFPLLDTQSSSVSFWRPDPISKGGSTSAVPRTFRVKPGGFCPPGSYSFFRNVTNWEVPVFAGSHGMANAAFRWWIGGVEVSVRNQWTTLSVITALTVKDPDGKIENVSSSVTIEFGIIDAWNASGLYLKTISTLGNCTLNIAVSAKEAAAPAAEPGVSNSDQALLETVTWLPGDDMKRARKSCNPFRAAIDTSVWGLSARLSDVKNRPDPPGDRTIKEIADSVHQLDRAVEQYAAAGQMTREEVWSMIRTGDGLRSQYGPALAPGISQKQNMQIAENPENAKEV